MQKFSDPMIIIASFETWPSAPRLTTFYQQLLFLDVVLQSSITYVTCYVIRTRSLSM